jgi:hypothetical protein
MHVYAYIHVRMYSVYQNTVSKLSVKVKDVLDL